MARGKSPVFPRVHIVLDSNALWNNRPDQLSSKELAEFISSGSKQLGIEVHWYLPQPVREERRRHMVVEARALLNSLEKMESLLGIKLGFTDENIGIRVDEAINRQANDLSLEHIELDLKSISWDELTRRAFLKEPPFKAKGEGGFKDALILECFATLVDRLPQNRTRIVLLTKDEDLANGTKSRMRGKKHVVVAADLGELKGLLNAVAAHLDQETIDKIVPKARVLFWDFDVKDGLYGRHGVYKKITDKYGTLMNTYPGGDEFTAARP